MLSVEPRAEQGSRASRRLRRHGLVPGVVYGIGSDSVSFKVDARRLRAVLAEGHALFDLEVEGDGDGRQPVIVKDQQHDPVRGSVLHLDLLKVRLDEKIQATVPLELEGVEMTGELSEIVVATVTAPSEVEEEEEIEEEAELVGEEGEVAEGEEGAAPEGEGEGGEAAESGGEES